MSSRSAATPETVDDYLARVPPMFRAMLLRLRKTIRTAAPDAQEIISYGMPAYRQDGILVYFAAFRDHCSLFVPGPEVRRRFAGELKPFLRGKGTLQFTPDRPLPAGLITRIVRTRVAENAARRPRKARPTAGRKPRSLRGAGASGRAARERGRSESGRARKRQRVGGQDTTMPLDRLRVLVRPATRTDIAGIVEVTTTSLDRDEDSGFGAPSQTFADTEQLAAAWREPNLVRGEEVLVAEFNGRVVGVVTVHDRGTALELINIDVPKVLQGRGIGSQIVRFVEERVRQERKQAVTLGTSRNAEGVAWRSLPWWQAQGYRITHEEENEWTRSISPAAREIRMRKDLANEGGGTA